MVVWCVRTLLKIFSSDPDTAAGREKFSNKQSHSLLKWPTKSISFTHRTLLHTHTHTESKCECKTTVWRAAGVSECLYLLVTMMLVFLCPGYWTWSLNTSPSSCLISERCTHKHKHTSHLIITCSPYSNIALWSTQTGCVGVGVKQTERWRLQVNTQETQTFYWTYWTFT